MRQRVMTNGVRGEIEGGRGIKGEGGGGGGGKVVGVGWGGMGWGGKRENSRLNQNEGDHHEIIDVPGQKCLSIGPKQNIIVHW